jgi:hypothetical protein
MRGKLTNLSFVMVLVVGFTMFVAGLERSRGVAPDDAAGDDGVIVLAEDATPDAGPAGPDDTVVVDDSAEGVTVLTEPTAEAETTLPSTDPPEPDVTIAPSATGSTTPPTTPSTTGSSTGAAGPERREFTIAPTPTRTPTPINVGNFVWDDIDGDGRQDAGEPGLSGYTVQLWNSTKTNLIDSDVTNANGNYTVVAPTPGNYRVRVVLKTGDTFSPKDSASATDTTDSDINPSGTNFGFTDTYVFASNLISITSIDAGIKKFRTPTPTRTPTPVNFGNFVWDDIDGDGRQDAGEPGLSGYTVQLWNSTKTNLIDTDVTSASGNYTVTSPGPGNYRIRVLLKTGDTFSPKDSASATDTTDSDINPSGTNFGFTDIYNIASNVISITSIDAGIKKFRTPTPTRTPTPVNFGNFVWDDIDGDGLQDAGEPGVAGYTVQLWNSTKTLLIDSDVTNASGNYTVTSPGPGNYRIRVLLNGGDSFSPKDVGSDDTDDSDINPSGADAGFTDIYAIASNVISITSIDAGIEDPSPPPTPTPTVTPTATPTPDPSATATPEPTATPTPEPFFTPTPEPTPTPDPFATPTPDPNATPVPGSTTTTTQVGSGVPLPGTPTATVVSPVLPQGAEQTGIARGFIPGEVVSAVQQSDPLDLGDRVADADGTATFTWTIRDAETLGEHLFIPTGEVSGSAVATFDVVSSGGAGGLPATGSNTVTTLLWAAAAIVVGMSIVIAVRRSVRRAER